MTIYRLVWRGFCATFGLIGIVSGVFLLPGRALVSLAVVGTAISLATIVGLQSRTDEPGRRRSAGRLTLIAVACCAALVATMGLGLLIGAGGVISIALLLGLGSPAVVLWCGRRLGWTATEPKFTDTRVSPTASTADICREWQETYTALNTVNSTARLRIVMTRQRCLDELERRDPAGLNAWLSSSMASAGGNPRPFLSTNADDGNS
ncbi:hypothetical protein [Kribbella sp. CA-293567]|uniref:hypothetical protein n=1 Tax=Kribbella sp. CA-293567 TaxID=3002436 RepID=UPI0022DE9367|nr:hypothetical protein [Kribbella sp. CA-293567]WBQ08300.1 hypothetical protein OX958_16165 [Kribbella sp. CA-293567]